MVHGWPHANGSVDSLHGLHPQRTPLLHMVFVSLVALSSLDNRNKSRTHLIGRRQVEVCEAAIVGAVDNSKGARIVINYGLEGVRVGEELAVTPPHVLHAPVQ